MRKPALTSRTSTLPVGGVTVVPVLRIDAVDARGRGYSVKTRRLDTAALVTR